jgi:transposase
MEVKDAAWLAELLQQGLLRASFIPPMAQRALRDLTRYRSTFSQARVAPMNRAQKLLEDANIKLAAVASDIMGVSGRAMLAALVAGDTDPHVLAELAQGRLRRKRDQLAQALAGRVKPHHRLVLTELWCHIDSLDEIIARFDAQIQAICGPFEGAVERLDTIPGVARRTAEMLVAEIGTDMPRFPSADHLASWAGVAPGNQESAGKRTSGKTRKGNRFLRTTLVQAVHAAAHQGHLSRGAIPTPGGASIGQTAGKPRLSRDAAEPLNKRTALTRLFSRQYQKCPKAIIGARNCHVLAPED